MRDSGVLCYYLTDLKLQARKHQGDCEKDLRQLDACYVVDESIRFDSLKIGVRQI